MVLGIPIFPLISNTKPQRVPYRLLGCRSASRLASVDEEVTAPVASPGPREAMEELLGAAGVAFLGGRAAGFW